MDEIMTVEPTEAVVMFGVNDMGTPYYNSEEPSERDLSERAACRRSHLENTVNLVKMLVKKNIPVTLCSAVGRDEYTKSDVGEKTYGATKALFEMFEDNKNALSGMLKNTVDYLSPLQELGAALANAGLPSVFADDRTHPNDLGQAMMARIFLRAQGLPVILPSVDCFKCGWRERELPADLSDRLKLEWILRSLHWIYPHQKSLTGDLSLEGRVAFFEEELKKDLSEFHIRMYTNYVENAPKEDELFEEYLSMTNALYSDRSAK